MTMPMAKLDLLAGYAIAFGAVAALQAALVSAVGFVFLDLDAGHSVALVIALAIANGLVGMSLGLFVSAFAKSEFQAVQFMPAFLLPQILLCGLFTPRDEMAPALETVSDFLPITYAFDGALARRLVGALGSEFTLDVVVVVGTIVLALAGGAATLAGERRDTRRAMTQGNARSFVPGTRPGQRATSTHCSRPWTRRSSSTRAGSSPTSRRSTAAIEACARSGKRCSPHGSRSASKWSASSRATSALPSPSASTDKGRAVVRAPIYRMVMRCASKTGGS